jgi:hypothetical protein
MKQKTSTKLVEESFLVTIEFATKRFNPYVLVSNVILQSI